MATRLGEIGIGGSLRPYIIAEVGQAHDGSLGIAHSYIDFAKDAGANAVKFQTHIAEEETTFQDEFRVKFAVQDKARFDYWKRMEFSPEQWYGLMQHAKSVGLEFISSAFSLPAFEMLDKLGQRIWKVGSGEMHSADLLQGMSETNKPILLSNGLVTNQELQKVVGFLQTRKSEFAILHCTSKYPTPNRDVGLNNISYLRDTYTVPVGLSDHTGEVFSSLAAVALGASVIEVHITHSKRSFGPDTLASLEFEDLKMLVSGSMAIHEMLSAPVDRSSLADDLVQMRNLFSKSLALKTDLKKGDVITAENLTLKKPGTGLAYEERFKFIGLRASRDLSRFNLLTYEDAVE